MANEIAILEQLNMEIGAAETRGDRDWLAGVVAPKLAFLRASGKIDCRADYLDAVAPADPRTTWVEAIHLHGNRAVVSCIVTVKTAGGDQRYHNLRLFIRHQQDWKLLGWANEPE